MPPFPPAAATACSVFLVRTDDLVQLGSIGLNAIQRRVSMQQGRGCAVGRLRSSFLFLLGAAKLLLDELCMTPPHR